MDNANSTKKTAPQTRDALVARYRELGRAMANELMSDADMAALRRERDAVSAKIAALPEAK